MKAKAEIVNALEAALFSSERPLTLRDLQILFDKRVKKESIETALIQLQEDYADRGVELVQVAGGYRFQTRAVHAPALRALRESRPPRYSRALLETLAIIAYRQPVTRGDIEEIRGVTVTTEIMRVLIEREWIRQSGTREVPGHPALYVTTPLFLEYFGLQSLNELPSLDEERQLAEIARELGIEMPESLRITAPAATGDEFDAAIEGLGDALASSEEEDLSGDDGPVGPDDATDSESSHDSDEAAAKRVALNSEFD